MPFELPPLSVSERVDALNDSYKHHAAIPVLKAALEDPIVGHIGLVSSFGAESIVLLHMVSLLDRTLPILFIDTELLFPETLDYQQSVATDLGLTNLRVIKAAAAGLAARDPDGTLHLTNPDACCALRKTEPLDLALSGFDAWITGRKRFQSGARAKLDLFETDTEERIKLNPLAHWRKEDVQDYIINNRLPRHPLLSQGYKSIGCAPCTSPVNDSEDDRAGRWRGQEKTECGIHFGAGKAQRGAQ